MTQRAVRNPFGLRALARVVDDSPENVRAKVITIYLLLVSATVIAWTLALMAFATRPLLLGTALIAYTFGLRHAVDADHISAIDNVTRKLMQAGSGPSPSGFSSRSAIRRSSSPSRSRSPSRRSS